ncbi:MAG: hypothetical protein QXS85_01720 [Acidilobaceae archaeon]
MRSESITLRLGFLLMLLALLALPVYLAVRAFEELLSLLALTTMIVMALPGLGLIAMNLRRLEHKSKLYLLAWLWGVARAVVAGLVAGLAILAVSVAGVFELSYRGVLLVAYAVFYLFLLLSIPRLVKVFARISRVYESRMAYRAGWVAIVVMALIALSAVPALAGYAIMAYLLLALAYAITVLLLAALSFKL